MLSLLLASNLLALVAPPTLPPVPGSSSSQAEPTPTPPSSATVEPAPAPTAAPESGEPAPAPSPEPAPTAVQDDPVPAPAPAPAEVPPTAEPPQPTEVAGPPPSEASSATPVAPDPLPIEVAQGLAPFAAAGPLEPRYRGRGLLIAGAATGAVGIGLKLWFSASALGSSDSVAILSGGFLYNPLIGTGLGLLGGGMGLRGRYQAHRALFDNTPAPWKRRAVLGWSLFGGGMAVWAITRLAAVLGCNNEQCLVGTLETGYYISLAATIPGMVMGSYGSGYNSYEHHNRRLARQVAVRPSLGRNRAGLSLSGRF